LIGARLKAFAKELHGVDLSSAMLEICRRKALYDNLVHADIHDYLKRTNRFFELIVAADFFNYLGDLQAVLDLCRTRKVSGSAWFFVRFI